MCTCWMAPRSHTLLRAPASKSTAKSLGLFVFAHSNGWTGARRAYGHKKNSVAKACPFSEKYTGCYIHYHSPSSRHSRFFYAQPAPPSSPKNPRACPAASATEVSRFLHTNLFQFFCIVCFALIPLGKSKKSRHFLRSSPIFYIMCSYRPPPGLD